MFRRFSNTFLRHKKYQPLLLLPEVCHWKRLWNQRNITIPCGNISKPIAYQCFLLAENQQTSLPAGHPASKPTHTHTTIRTWMHKSINRSINPEIYRSRQCTDQHISVHRWTQINTQINTQSNTQINTQIKTQNKTQIITQTSTQNQYTNQYLLSLVVYPVKAHNWNWCVIGENKH